ncbi:hypothetical protein TNCV_1791911 [Trichonephila clavipes]|nr:hypothetical protein TNCV_1791911 [Trichonephila clavipes]
MTAAREGYGSFARPGSPMKEGRKIRSQYFPFCTQVLYQPRQNYRLRVMFGSGLYRYHTTTDPSHAFDCLGRAMCGSLFLQN